MANKEKTLEELKVEAELAQKSYELAWKAEEQKKKAEEEKKKAKLAAEKEKRYQEIQDAEQKLIELKTAYIKDYGSYGTRNTIHYHIPYDLADFLELLR